MTPRSLVNARVRFAARRSRGRRSLIAISGCDPRTLAYFLQPFDPTIAAPMRDLARGEEGRRSCVT